MHMLQDTLLLLHFIDFFGHINTEYVKHMMFQDVCNYAANKNAFNKSKNAFHETWRFDELRDKMYSFGALRENYNVNRHENEREDIHHRVSKLVTDCLNVYFISMTVFTHMHCPVQINGDKVKSKERAAKRPPHQQLHHPSRPTFPRIPAHIIPATKRGTRRPSARRHKRQQHVTPRSAATIPRPVSWRAKYTKRQVKAAQVSHSLTPNTLLASLA